jgi:hypothetical protein
MMDYATACRRLSNHANLPEFGPENESLGLALWYISRGQEPQGDILALLHDVIKCLGCVNLAINGKQPSETPNSGKEMSIDRWLCYSVTCLLEIQLGALRSPKTDPKLVKTILAIAHRISYAWACVLAGDIDEVDDPHGTLETGDGSD